MVLVSSELFLLAFVRNFFYDSDLNTTVRVFSFVVMFPFLSLQVDIFFVRIDYVEVVLLGYMVLNLVLRLVKLRTIP